MRLRPIFLVALILVPLGFQKAASVNASPHCDLAKAQSLVKAGAETRVLFSATQGTPNPESLTTFDSASSHQDFEMQSRALERAGDMYAECGHALEELQAYQEAALRTRIRVHAMDAKLVAAARAVFSDRRDSRAERAYANDVLCRHFLRCDANLHYQGELSRLQSENEGRPAHAAAQTVEPAHTAAGTVTQASQPFALSQTTRTCAQPNAPATTLQAAVATMPAEAQQQGIEGTVQVQVSLDQSSAVTNVAIYSSPSALLNDAALQAARKSIFRTAIRNCRPVAADYLFSITFGD